jgi:hypothetical protein
MALLARLLIVMLSSVSLFGAAAIFFLNKRIGPSYAEGIYTLGRLQAHLPYLLFITAFVQALTLCAIALLLTLLWSHAVAGPLVRFRKHLRELAQGKIPKEPLTFRESDQLHGLAQAFSELALARRDASAKALALLVGAQKLIDQCQGLEGEPQALEGKLKELEKIYGRVKELHAFQEPDS